LRRLFPLFLLLVPAQAAEVVHLFAAELRLDASGVLTVRERIAVTAEHERIRRGIYRDLLLAPADPFARGRIRVEILGALLDGRPVPYRVERSFRALRVYLGDPARYVPRGRHVYELRYRVEGAVRPGPELLWNVTGNDWAFPIERAEAVFYSAVSPTRLAAFVGAYGSRAEVPVQEEDGAYRARARDLPPGSALTLLARFPPGSLPVRSGGEPVGALLLALAGTLLALYLFAWRRLGKDPEGPPVIPRFHPPQGVSAPLARLLVTGRKDHRAFLAGVFELAQKGHLTLERGLTGYRIHRKNPETSALLPELRALFEALFQNRASLAVEREEAAALSAAQSALFEALGSRERDYLRKNGVPFWAGTLLSSLLLGLLAYRAAAGSFSFALVAALYSLTAALFGQSLLHRAALAWEAYRRVPGLAPLPRLFAALCYLTLLLALPLPAGFFALFLLGPKSALAVYALLLLNAVFGYLLPAYTKKGAAQRAHLLGLARYLAVTDEAELSRIGAPEDTPAHLEALFPFAVALGLEAPLARRLTRALARARERAEAVRTPVFTWYRGPELSPADPASLARVPTLLSRDLTRGFLAAYRRATAPENSGTGGGFSGGGVGGGGGGGW